MPREILRNDPCWRYIRNGCVTELRNLLSIKTISLFDVTDGVFLLSFALSIGKIKVAEALLEMGAEWDFASDRGLTAADHARTLVLDFPGHPDLEKLRSMIGREGFLDLQLGPLHRIVLGLSDANLAHQIEMEPGRIDEVDWSGMTPLMWAAQREDQVSVEVLLSHGARTDLACLDGRSAPHCAATNIRSS